MSYLEPPTTTTTQGLITLAGDLGGTATSPTVISVAHVTTGTLPAANQAAQTMGGAIGGTTAASTISLTGNASITGNLPVTNLAAGTANQVLINNATPVPAWITLSQDVTNVLGVMTVNSVSVTSGYTIASSILQKSVSFTDGYSGGNTQGATLTTIYTDSSIPASSVYDYVVSVLGVEPSTLDVYRADFSFTVINTAGTLSYIGASPVALNVRGTTNGLTFGGASIAFSTTHVLVQVTGKASTSIDWSCTINRISGS